MIPLLEFFQQKEEKRENKLDYANVYRELKEKTGFPNVPPVDNLEECMEGHFKQMNAYIKARKEWLYTDWKSQLEKTWQYKKPTLFNSEAVRELGIDEIYIAPVFVKSGRQFFVIQTGKGPETIELYKSIVDFR